MRANAQQLFADIKSALMSREFDTPSLPKSEKELAYPRTSDAEFSDLLKKMGYEIDPYLPEAEMPPEHRDLFGVGDLAELDQKVSQKANIRNVELPRLRNEDEDREFRQRLNIPYSVKLDKPL